jgi:hypothetical protein
MFPVIQQEGATSRVLDGRIRIAPRRSVGDCLGVDFLSVRTSIAACILKQLVAANHGLF